MILNIIDGEGVDQMLLLWLEIIYPNKIPIPAFHYFSNSRHSSKHSDTTERLNNKLQVTVFWRKASVTDFQGTQSSAPCSIPEGSFIYHLSIFGHRFLIVINCPIFTGRKSFLTKCSLFWDINLQNLCFLSCNKSNC